MSKHSNITNGRIIEVLKTPGSLAKKAQELGVSQGLFHQRSRVDPEVQAAFDHWRTLPRLPYPTKIIPPQQIGDWKLLGPAEKRERCSTYWFIQHKCGKIREISGSELKRSPPSTCRACRGNSLSPGDYVGEWKILEKLKKRWKNRASFWSAQHPACGVIRTFTTSGLRRQAQQECKTCLRKKGHQRVVPARSKAWKNRGFR